MVAADGRIDLRGAAEVGHPDDERLVEQPLLLEVDQQRRDRLIDRRHPPFQPVEAVGVVVPARIADGHESNTRLHEPTGEEEPLAEGGPPVVIAQARRFGADVEGPLRLRRRDHREGGLVVLVEGIVGGRLPVGGALEPIDTGEDGAAPVDPRHLHVERRGDVADGELVGIGIGMDLKRAVRQPQDPRHSAVARAIDVGPELDEGGEGRLEAVLVGDNRADTWIDERRIDVAPRHAPMVGHAMAGVARVPAAEERVAAQFPGHPPAQLGEKHPRHRRGDCR